MGEDFDGFKAWIKRRREELAGSLEYQLLVSTLNECDSGQRISALARQERRCVDSLDGEESREFEVIVRVTQLDGKLPNLALMRFGVASRRG
jgi:hypothetical protein